MEKNPLDDDLLKELGLDGDLDLSTGQPDHETKPESGSLGENTDDLTEFEEDPTTGVGRNHNQADFDSFSRAPTDPGQSANYDSPSEPIITPPVQKKVQGQKQMPSGSVVEDMPIQMVGVLAKKTMTLKDVLALKQGEVVDMKKLPGEHIDLVANGKLIARGQLVLIDGSMGIQIKQIIV